MEQPWFYFAMNTYRKIAFFHSDVACRVYYPELLVVNHGIDDPISIHAKRECG